MKAIFLISIVFYLLFLLFLNNVFVIGICVFLKKRSYKKIQRFYCRWKIAKSWEKVVLGIGVPLYFLLPASFGNSLLFLLVWNSGFLTFPFTNGQCSIIFFFFVGMEVLRFLVPRGNSVFHVILQLRQRQKTLSLFQKAYQVYKEKDTSVKDCLYVVVMFPYAIVFRTGFYNHFRYFFYIGLNSLWRCCIPVPMATYASCWLGFVFFYTVVSLVSVFGKSQLLKNEKLGDFHICMEEIVEIVILTFFKLSHNQVMTYLALGPGFEPVWKIFNWYYEGLYGTAEANEILTVLTRFYQWWSIKYWHHVCMQGVFLPAAWKKKLTKMVKKVCDLSSQSKDG